jgi:hypothetical protein
MRPQPRRSRYSMHCQLVYIAQRHSMIGLWCLTPLINHYDRHITHLGVLDISCALFNVSSEFLLYLECYLISLVFVLWNTNVLL